MIGGDALLVAGYDATAEVDDPRLSLVTQLGEAVLASASPWRVRRLAAGGPDRDVPSRGNVRRALDAMLDRPASARLVVVAAELTRTIEGLGLVCGQAESEYREDATVSLEWFAQRLRRAANVPTAFVVAAPDAESIDARTGLDVLGTASSEHVIAIAAGDPLTTLRILIDGLWSDAIDLATGSVTPSSLGSYLQRRLPRAAIQPSASIGTLLAPRGLARADLAERAHRRPDAGRDELIGAVLPGQFRVTAELARGNYGVVYRAHQEMVDRDVAIKVLPVRLGAEAIRRFALEIRAVGRLDHRNVVRVWHADVTRDGRMFVAMELLSGPTLQELVARGPVSPEVALQLARQLLAGLAAAHAAGIIHADVKPANAILVDGAEQRVALLDFGLACLRADEPVAVGGTPGFTAPEQLRGEPIDACVDVYATALVALALVAGAPPLDAEARDRAIATFADQRVRAALRRALEDDPAARFASAGEMLAELDGKRANVVARPARRSFRIAPFSEQEHDDFHGRQHEVELLLEHVLFRRAVVYVAPSGTGKTSLLLAGLVPRLRELDLDVAYVSCRAGITTPIADAMAQVKSPSTRKLVLIVDQVEAVLASGHHADGEAVLEGLGMPSWPLDTPISVVWAVREEYLGRLLDRVRRIEPGVPIERLGPLTPESAAYILRQTFERRGTAIDPELIERLVSDLASAAARLASELGWGDAPTVYPPHLQLAGAMLERERGAVDLGLYERNGGFQTILGEHLHHVLANKLGEPQTAIARDILLAVMTSSRAQVACEERDLFARVGHAGRSNEEIDAVLQILRDSGLLVTARRPGGEAAWDLAHDSLVTEIESWLTTTDAARRRAMDLVRYRLERSTPDRPSRLGVVELREVRAHLDAQDVAALDREWHERSGVGPRPAARLLAASRSAIRFYRATLGAFAVAAIAIAGVFAHRWLEGRRELTLRDRDIGETRLELRAFDWDPVTLSPIDTVSADFTWDLVRPSLDDPDLPGARFADEDLASEPLRPPAGAVRADTLTVRGGPAILVIGRRDRTGTPCTPVVVPIRKLPGYDHARSLTLRIPTCEASAADMISIPAGPFFADGVGDPPSPKLQKSHSVERTLDQPAFALDRTEVPNALLSAVSAALEASDRRLPIYPDTDELVFAGAADRPVASLTWHEAALVCRLLGKRLPTSQEWRKAARGGMTLAAGAPNRYPHRNMPWGPEPDLSRANVNLGGAVAPTPVGSHPADIGPYGHVDLAGNVSEWTATLQSNGFAIIRGGNWSETTNEENLINFCAIENPRPPKFSMYTIGFRCASDLPEGQLRQEILSQRTPQRDVQVDRTVPPRAQTQ